MTEQLLDSQSMVTVLYHTLLHEIIHAVGPLCWDARYGLLGDRIEQLALVVWIIV